MSGAERLAETLAEARTVTTAAVGAAGNHRHRHDPTWPAHIHDLRSLVIALESLHYLTTSDLPGVVKVLADDARRRYFADSTPDNKSWPEPVKNAAGEANRALSRLRAHLEKAPVGSAHSAMAVLLETVRTARQASR